MSSKNKEKETKENADTVNNDVSHASLKELTITEKQPLSVAVIGVGNIGKPLLRRIHEKELFDRIIGIDKDSVNLSGLENTLVEITNDISMVKDMDIVVVCISSRFKVNDGSIEGNIKELIEFCTELDLKPGALLIIESTVPLGTIDVIIDKYIEKGNVLGEDIFIAYCPERIDRIEWNEITAQVRVVSANDDASLIKASSFYQVLGCDVTEVNGVKKAEAVKLYENFSRLAQIEFANEFAKYCVDNNLPPVEVMMKAMTKTNVQTILPGAVGGHCLPESALMVSNSGTNKLFNYLAHNAKKRIDKVVSYTTKFLLRRKQPLVLALGLGYKPGVKDVRGSPALEFNREIVDIPVRFFDAYIGNPYPSTVISAGEKFDVIITFHKVPFYMRIVEKHLRKDGLLIDFTGAYYGLATGDQKYYFP